MSILTAAEVMAYAKAAGFPVSVLPQAAAYAGIESGWNTNAVSSTGCIGLWQICGTQVSGDLKDPSVNAKAAFAKWKSCNGGSFACDWDPYDQGQSNPNWGTYFNQALQAAGGALPTVSGTSGSTATSGASKTTTPQNTTCAPWDIGCIWSNLQQDLTGVGVAVGLGLLAVLIILGAFIIMASKTASDHPEAAQAAMMAV